MQLDPYQVAMKDRSTTQALPFLLHNVLETLDQCGSSVRIFLADFSEGFHLVDHSVSELEKLNIRPALVGRIVPF